MLKRHDLNLDQELVKEARSLLPRRGFSRWVNGLIRAGLERLRREKGCNPDKGGRE